MRDSSGLLHFENALDFARQANETLESRTASSDAPPLALVFRFLFQDDDELPPILAARVRQCRESTGEVKPALDDEVIAELDAMLSAQRPVIPRQWTSSLGTGEQLSRTFRNLWLAGIAHVVSVSNASIPPRFDDAQDDTREPNGLNVDWILGEVTADWLIKVMGMNGGVAPAAANELLTLLTYGYATKHPDPALQFLFPLRDGQIAIPWLFYATCNAERNLLTLLARTRKADFDSASDAFEDAMLDDVRTAIAARGWTARFSSNLPREAAAGEVDVLLIDPVDRFVLLCELRWFIEPSEVGEVAEREKAGSEKHAQATRKVEAAHRVIEVIAQEAGLPPGPWTVEPLAVFDNYLPMPRDAAVPFVSHRAFLSAVNQFDRLGAAFAWLRDGRWLPRRDEHFVVQPVETDIGVVKFLLDGQNPTPEGEAFVLARDEVQLQRWVVQFT